MEITPALMTRLLAGLSDQPASSPRAAHLVPEEGGGPDIMRGVREVYEAVRAEPVPAHLLALVERLYRESIS